VVVSELIPLAEAKHIDLGISRADELEILGDAEGVRTLLRNLVDNAVRYTDPAGRVDVGVELAPGGSAVLRVIDDGPGIPPAERARVFDRFYRRAGMQAPGSGLGMAIVKAIADAHGATIELGGRPEGQGLAVAVTFPPSSLLRNSAAVGR
jgi:two-component system OmpR family sensor kinase